MTAVMVDLETMSTAPDAAIVQIGACSLDGGARYKRNVSLQSSLDAGLRIDGSTVNWWLCQSEDARSSLRGDLLPLDAALTELSAWLDAMGVTELWAFPAQFDLVILASAYRAAKIEKPWSYRVERCARTLIQLAPAGFRRSVATLKHDALSDAVAQAADVLRCKELLNVA